MIKLLKNIKPIAWMLLLIIVLVTGQAVSELYLPQKMSEIIDEGIYIDYEPLYKHEEMDRPSSISGVDSEKTLKGYDSDKIPVFEMRDGFSTYDLRAVIEKNEGIADLGINFRDIPIKDSKQLFDTVITPFVDGLKPYQAEGQEFYDLTLEEKREVIRVINSLIICDVDPVNNAVLSDESIEISSTDDEKITINTLLDVDNNEEEDAMSNENNRKILTACIACMKHSRYGNLAPIPIDADGNRLATDEYGQAIEQDKLRYVYSDEDENEVETAKESFTGRPDELPDYETIICNNVLGFSYKFVGDKWPADASGKTNLGITDQRAQQIANSYNSNILIKELLTDNSKKFTEEKITELSLQIEKMIVWYESDDELILLEDLLKYKNRSAKAIEKRLDQYFTAGEGDVASKKEILDSGWKKFWIKLGNYLTLSPTGTQRETGKVVTFKTAKDVMLPNGETQQTSDMKFILTRGGYMLLLTICTCSCAIAAAFFSSKLASEFAAKVRSLVFGKVETFSIAEIDHFSTASLITRSTNDINQIQHVTLMTLRTGLIAPITLIGGFIMSAEKSFYMTSVIFYDLPILVLASLVAGKVVYPLFQVIQQKVDRLTLVAREGLTGIRVVRAFNKQDTENVKFDEVNTSLTKTAVVVNKWCAVLAPLISVVMNCSMVGVVWRASQQIAGTVDKGDVNVGDMMAVIQYMTQIMLALVMVATVILLIPRAIASAKRINEVLETELSLTDSDTPNRNYTDVGTVEFKHVNFKFSEKAEKNILTDIDFTARKGEVTAIVGGTGSGKSAVINLIPRFYDVMEGEVIVDGVNVKDIPIKELREKIGFVPQRSVLFSGTIRDNLCYGKEDATDEEIWEALEIAQSDTFVRDKENGIETRVEQGGGNFSGGQKQRLAIARAIIRKPEVLIFDDSFSALDFRTDKNLRTALKKITKDSATIIVAQRIGTIMDADNILVLDEGKIVGQGKHEYLIKECKLYRDIALSQMSEEELGL